MEIEGKLKRTRGKWNMTTNFYTIEMPQGENG